MFSFIAGTVLEVDVGSCKVVDHLSIEVSPLNAADTGLSVAILAVSASR